ncbi:MAG TPA: plastocyanin/azurin family copper-binding protein [Gemmatimonadales bacterium]|jgi:plastocyanin|nr:plastocyanin/azurin family copper-binding protein [Gemmatimonadales bacterium]
MRLPMILAVAAALTFAACSSSTGPGGTGGRSTSVTVSNDFYSITPDTVASGAQITWTWTNASNSHSVNWDSGPEALPANSAVMTTGTYHATLTTAGTYRYHCVIHGSAMSGVIVIQ